ncbi:hypothetical protein ANRL4_02727 [Anaerolineae bacterium]|nr:hypothetical protein ANRL4_02727 [Anaerolineae bacterium]
MSDLVARYIHQVGQNLPKKDRAEIEAELRSQIEDALEDRFAGNPSQADVVTLLGEFGPPYQMAASYRTAQYLIGPDLYPYLMMVLRHVWLIVPAIVIFLSLFGALTGPQPILWSHLFPDLIGAVVQVTFVFSALVVLIFALVEKVSAAHPPKPEPFDPSKLPAVNDPRAVDRFEAGFGSAFGVAVVSMLLYFLYVGGLTLRFNLSDPGAVIPVPSGWLILLIVVAVGQILIQLWVLRRNRWNATLWLLQTIMELVGVVSLYFAVLEPLAERALSATESPTARTIIANAPELFAIGYAVIALSGHGMRLIRLWGYKDAAPMNEPLSASPH